MRRILTVALLALGVVTLAACGSAGGGGADPVPSSNWNELVWSEGSWSE